MKFTQIGHTDNQYGLYGQSFSTQMDSRLYYNIFYLVHDFVNTGRLCSD